MSINIPARPGYLINRCARLFARWGEVQFRPLGLSMAQVPVLACLKDGMARTQKELARLIQIEQPTMAQLLARMERDGLIRRTSDPKDKRSSLLSLTELAESRLPQARAVLDQGSAIALQGLSVHEIDTLTRLLTRVLDNVSAATAMLDRNEADAGEIADE
jgi:MarR family transcriptional regulator, transcriptional regulator for hemolysin